MEKDVNNNIDNDFADINKQNKYKNYIIVIILYVIVIILTVFLILGIKNQKDVVENNIDKDENKENVVEQNSPISDQESINNKESLNNNTEFNILDQV